MSASIWAMLADHAARDPDLPSILTRDRTISRAEAAARVAGLAAWLSDAGLVPGRVVGVTLPDETGHVLVTLALMALGVPSLNLPTHERPDRHAALARTLDLQAVLCSPGHTAPPGCRVLVPPLDAILPSGPDVAERLRAIAFAPDQVPLYRTTSGTTGTPKVLGLRMTLCVNAIARIAASETERCVLRGNTVEHDSTRIYRVTGLLAGRQAAFLDSITAANLGPFCRATGVTEVQMGTYKLAGLLSARDQAINPLPDHTRILTGGSRVSGALRAAIAARLTPNLWISYATSETGIISFAGPQDHVAWPEGIGQPLPGVAVSLRDDAGHEVARGVIGTAFVRKAGVALDKDGQPGWHSTGDLVSWPEDGPLVFHGRADDMMILNGINIFPGPIEDALERHPAVAEAAAFGLPSAIHGQIPVVAVVLRSAAEVAELMRFARDALGLQAPRQIRIVADIPRNAAGKPLRRVLAGVSDPSR